MLQLGASASHGLQELRGDWAFAWHQFADPLAPLPPGPATAARVPAPWNGVLVDGKPAGGDGWATYRLDVACPPGEKLALTVPAQRTAMRFYVNGQLAVQQGTPAIRAADARPAIGPRAVLTEPFACPLRITAHVSNWSHRTGGLVRAPVAGPHALLADDLKQRVVRHTLLLGAYLVLGTVPVIFFLARRKDPTPLLFGLFCLMQALYADMIGERLLLQLFTPQAPWEAYLKVEYLAWFGAMALFLLLVHHLFERELQPRIVRGLLAGFALAAFVVLMTPARLFSHLVGFGQFMGVALGVYITYCIARAARHGRADAGILLAGVGFLFLVVVLDVLQYNAGWVLRSITPFGLLAFVLSPAIVLARRLARALNAEELRAVEQREKADLLVRTTQAGILDWDDTRNLTTYAPRLKEMLGHPADADTSGWPPFFERIHPYERERVRALFMGQLKSRAVKNGEMRHPPSDYRLIRRDGSHVWVHAEAISLHGSDGRMLRYICSFLDITDQRALAEGLQRQNAAFAENARLRDDVERMSRHDLKTPLNSVIGVTRLLREDPQVRPEHRELLQITERAGYRLLELINLSLDLSRMELGSYDFRPQAVNLLDVVTRVMLDLHGLAESNRVRLRLDRSPTGPVYARGEELLCYSIVANLLKNAIEATPACGTVTIQLVPGEPVRLHIHNPGQVPPGIATTFFDKYVTAGKSGGTGLGTYSAQLMARVQEGDLAMQSPEGAGTTLTLTLRALGAEQLPPPVQLTLLQEPARPPAAELAVFQGKRVLVVDDDEYNRLLLRRYLPSPPFIVEAAVNGLAATEAVLREWPDVVLIDMEMPVMNGLEAVAWIRERELDAGRPPCVIVMLSSNDDDRSIRRGLAAGSNRYLTKPVTREALLAVLEDLFDAPAPEVAPAATPAPTPPADESAVVEVDAALVAQAPQLLMSRAQMADAMHQALVAGDRQELKALAHRAGGGLAAFGFTWAAWQCRQIEQHALHGEAAGLLAQIGRLQAHLAVVQVRGEEKRGA